LVRFIFTREDMTSGKPPGNQWRRLHDYASHD
jgi:hypothetical protein